MQVIEDSATDARPTWTRVTQLYFALLAARLALYVFQYGAPYDVVARPAVETFLAYGQVGLLVAGMAVGLFWLYRAWTRVPSAHRLSFNGRPVEPRQAALRMLIPVYDFYWLFVANLGLVSAIERQLAAGKPRRRPDAGATFALVCCVVQLVPAVNLLVSPLLWAAFMVRIDAVQDGAERASK